MDKLLAGLLAILLLTDPAEAARQFNGTNQSLQSASAIDLTAFSKVSIAFWLWWDAFADDDEAALEFGTGTCAEGGTIFISPNSGGTQFATSTWDTPGCSPLSKWHFARAGVSTGAWHHYVFEIDRSLASSEIVAVYLDGSTQTLTADSDGNTVGAFGSFVLNLMSRNNASLFGAGRMAEVAIYGGLLLSGSDVSALYNAGSGVDARTVQSGSLVDYWQLCGTASPETPLVGAVNLTVNGATSVAHPISGTGICGAGGGPVVPHGRVFPFRRR